MNENEILITYGGEVKALPDNKIGGYLITFSDEKSPDLQGDFFQKDTDFGNLKTSDILYHHGLDEKVGLKVLGVGSLTIDDIGVWIEAQLDLAEKYTKAIYELVKKGKLGWSSGTASHRVTREKKGNANKILSWILGLDASLTPTPAEPRNMAMSLKSIKNTTELEVEGDSAAQDNLNNNNNLESKESNKMNDEEKKAAEAKAEAERIAAEEADKKNEIKTSVNIDPSDVQSLMAEVLEKQNQAVAAKTAKENAKKAMTEQMLELVDTAMKAANPDPNRMGSPALNLKTKRGDDANKALNHYLKTGDNGGLRAQPEYKTDYWLVEGTQYQGQELVPTEIAKRIFELRDPMSIARAAGSTILQVNSSVVNVPFERTRQGIFVAPGEKTAYDQLEQQIFDKKAITIVKGTRCIPIAEELMEDSVVDLVPYLTRNLARALYLYENTLFISGPTGAWYNATSRLTLASATVIAYDEPIKLFNTLNAEYRDRCAWVCTKTTEGLIRALNTAYHFPYAGNGQASGFMGNVSKGFGGGEILGFPVFNDANVDELGATKKSLMIGNFEAGYVIAERKALTIKRDDISSMASGVINILASTRIGGGVVNAEAFGVATCLTT